MFSETYSLHYNTASDTDGERQSTHVGVKFDSSDLESTLNHVRDFLRAVGYTYVARLVAVAEDGTDTAQSDM